MTAVLARARTLSALAILSLAGCYEIAPQAPSSKSAAPLIPGWPAPPVYSADAFHPANRLFQRLFVLGGVTPSAPLETWAEGEAARLLSDVPFSPRESLAAVDLAEAAALLTELDRPAEGRPPLGPAQRALLQSDLLAVLLRVSLTAEAGSLDALAGRAAAIGPPPEADLPGTLPPPLLAAGWEEATGPRLRGFRPSVADLRWTRTFRREGQALLLRLRIGARPGGEPVLLPLGSEAWLLARSPSGPPAGKVYRFRRSRLVDGADPWEETPAGTRARLRDPERPEGPVLAGVPGGLCAGCHPGPGLEARIRPEVSGAIGPPAGPPVQLDDAREALRRLLH